MLFIAFSPLVASASLTPEWSHDYGKALKEAMGRGKPIAIFIGSGKEGWQSVETGGLSNEASQLLKQHYVCLYVDTDTTDGKELADSFQMAGKRPALVISDKTAKWQAFKQAGPLEGGRLEQALKQYTAYEVPQSQIQRAYYSGPPAGAPIYTGGFSGGGRSC
jgi:hypothetical protein